MWDFRMGQALRLLLATMPFLYLRLGVYFGITLAYVLATGTGAGLGWGIGALGDEGFRAGSTFFGGLIGFGIVGAVVYWFREYLLYIIKAGHVAVLVEKMDGGSLPAGRSQIDHARGVVQERFKEASVLFLLDQLVKGVLRVIVGMVRSVVRLLPIPGANQLVGVLHAILRMAVGFIDEVILAYAIRTRSENPWQSSRTALVLYGQNYKAMLKNAVWLALFVYGLSILVFLVMLTPAAGLAYLIPGGWTATGVLIALLLAWSVKVAVIEPFAVTCMMQVFFKVTEGQQPDPEWERKLEDMSDRFKELARISHRRSSRGRRDAAVTGGTDRKTAKA